VLNVTLLSKYNDPVVSLSPVCVVNNVLLLKLILEVLSLNIIRLLYVVLGANEKYVSGLKLKHDFELIKLGLTEL